MKQRIKNRIIYSIIVLFVCALGALVAFEWPQDSQPIEVLFSESREGNFNSGVIFSNSSEVKVAERGRLIMTLKNNISDMGWFESPLGNTAIVAHSNDMISVYSNLTNIRVEPSERDLVEGDMIGISGESAWKSGNEGLHFQVIDTQMKTIINPVVLMNDVIQVRGGVIANVVAVNRNGVEFPMYNGAVLEAGSYRLYMDMPDSTMIHNSLVTLNGEVKETVNYDTLRQSDGELMIFGNTGYNFDDIYPGNDKMRLAELILSRGVNTIEIALLNVGQTQTSTRFRITVE